ncbi:MAG: replicative DNA helicase [Candidatus Nomurabacteria bacterium]|jgi:replicative DNA helicase|nr:replicative DNA helicase [Candidatus Nomurabacteria bacterium]
MSAKTQATTPGKIPPQNLEAEKSLLGSVLLDEDVLIDVVDKVQPDDFYDSKHKVIFTAMRHLYEKSTQVDLLTLSDELRKKKQLSEIGGDEYLTDLTNYVPTAAHAASYADIIAQAAVRRRLIKIGSEITELGFDSDKTVQELLQQAEAGLFTVNANAQRDKLVKLESILADAFDQMEELQRNKDKLRGLKTGFNDLDNMTAGFQKSDLIVLAARPSMGKTALALNLALNITSINDVSVAIFSHEMSKEQLVNRLLTDASGVDSWNIQTGNLRDDDFTKISEAMGELAESPIYIDDTPNMTILEMRTKARRAAHEHNLGLIIIDYLQLMQGSGRDHGNRVQEVSEISRGLKLIARELNVPVIALSQLSRAVESRTPPIPMLSDLRESGSIEQDADVVMFMYREDYYDPETERQHITDLILAKHRNGPTGKIELYFHPERLKFTSLSKKARS